MNPAARPSENVSPSFAKRIVQSVLPAAAVACALASLSFENGRAGEDSSAIFGVTIPPGYRKWQLVAPSQETGRLDELRAILGSDLSINAYRDRALPFPDGSILVKLAWKHVQSAEFAAAYVPGIPTTVQVMVKDSNRYHRRAVGDSADS
jgi:Cytochrome P460